MDADGPSGGISRLGPRSPESPLVVSVPHAGRDYPEALLRQAWLGRAALQSLEDRYVDRLVEPLAERGITTIVAHTARAWIDLNRSEREIDPEMVLPQPALSGIELSPKVRGGLGLIPRRLSGHGNIYSEPISAEDLSRRIQQTHRSFHGLVSEALAAARKRFGTAILLDCHSMPPLRPGGGEARIDIVLGDLEGRSAAPGFASRAAELCRANGLRVARNSPYAGGYILQRHGRPERGVHALQFEICRSLYLDPALDRPGNRFAEFAALVAHLATALADEALSGPESLAAE